MDATNPRSQLTDLPVELLFLIFRQAHCLQPQSRIYSTLRLVSRALDRVATQLVFESFMVTITPLTSSDTLGILHTIFETHAHLVRALTIRNTISRKCNVEMQTISRRAQHTIRQGFLRCTKIRSLACLGSHGMFSSRSWLSLPAPANLTSLAFTPNKGSTDLSYCLLPLKDSLQSLEIINWRPQHDNPSTFHLPTSLPHLTDLTLTECYPPSPHMTKLFSRIITLSSPQNTDPVVPLRSLTIMPESPTKFSSVFPRALADIVSILATRQFGSHLKTLCINSPRGNDVDATIPIALLRLCPNLVEFTYLCDRVHESFLNSLPSTLAVLRLAPCGYPTTSISSHVNILSPTSLARWLRDGPRRKRSAPGLRSVTVDVSGMNVLTMLQILEGGLRFARVPAAYSTCIDICLEGETIEVTLR